MIDEKELRECVNKKMLVADMAKHFGYSFERFTKEYSEKVKELKKEYADEIDKKIVELKKQGKTYEEISFFLNVGPNRIAKANKPFSLAKPKRNWNDKEFVEAVGKLIEENPKITNNQICKKLHTQAKTLKKVIEAYYPERIKQKSSKESETEIYKKGLKNNNAISLVKDKLKIGSKIKIDGRECEVISKGEYYFTAIFKAGYKECFLYQELLKREVV